MLKGAILTFDALMALAMISVAFSSVIVFSNNGPEFSKQPQLEALARDYLVAKYVYQKSFGAHTFSYLTNHSVSETFVDDNLTGHSELYLYPALCNCSTNCYLKKAVNTSCLTGQDTSKQYHYEAWVTP